MAGRYPGPVEAAVRRDLKALVSAHPVRDALEAMCLNLARRIDADAAGAVTAALNRQLLATMAELARLAVGDEDELDAELSAAVGNGPGTGPGDTGARDREGGG